MGFSGSRNNAGPRHRRDRCERPPFRNKQKLALPLEAFLEGALRAGGVDGMADDCGQQGEKFGDHFARHPKTAGRTFTGGADFFLKRFWRSCQRIKNLLLCHAGSLSEWEFVRGQSSGQDDPERRNFGRFGRKASKSIGKIDRDIGCWVFFLQGLEEGDK